jgi:8-amino-7-oxononanoate synthase
VSWREWAAEANAATKARGQWRRIRDFDATGVTGSVNGRPVVSFASNDYLGLSMHPMVVAAAADALARWGAGSGSARLIVGSRPVHNALEKELADWKNSERALLFPNGFTTNLGVLTAFGSEGTVIFSDELNHASIVDGCRLARATVRRFPHKDVGALHEMMKESSRSIVVSDTVFSMDGDVAPVDDLVSLASSHEALLVLDEAHAVLGPEPYLAGAEVIRVGTLSKFVGSFGGFAAGPGELIELLVNHARPFIFTTASTPADAAAALAGVELLRSAEGAALKKRLRALIDRVKPGHDSPILPFVIGDEAAAVAASERLLERGLLVPAIRPPSVPVGTARLRVTLSAAHTDGHVERLLAALHEIEVPIGA